MPLVGRLGLWAHPIARTRGGCCCCSKLASASSRPCSPLRPRDVAQTGAAHRGNADHAARCLTLPQFMRRRSVAGKGARGIAFSLLLRKYIELEVCLSSLHDAGQVEVLY